MRFRAPGENSGDPDGKGGQDAVADDGAVEGVKISRSGPLSISLDAPAESLIVVENLMVSGYNERGSKCHRIDRGAEGEPHLLARS